MYILYRLCIDLIIVDVAVWSSPVRPSSGIGSCQRNPDLDLNRSYSCCIYDIHNDSKSKVCVLSIFQYSVPDSKHTSSKLRSLPRLFPISLDCLPGF